MAGGAEELHAVPSTFPQTNAPRQKEDCYSSGIEPYGDRDQGGAIRVNNGLAAQRLPRQYSDQSQVAARDREGETNLLAGSLILPPA
jgi:hypothetical protein